MVGAPPNPPLATLGDDHIHPTLGHLGGLRGRVHLLDEHTAGVVHPLDQIR